MGCFVAPLGSFAMTALIQFERNPC
jgi:hypothetical protein